MSRGNNNYFTPSENRWSGYVNGPTHEQQQHRMPPIPRHSASSLGSLFQNGRQGTTQDPWLTYDESLTRQHVPFSRVGNPAYPLHVFLFDNILSTRSTYPRRGPHILPFSPPRLILNDDQQLPTYDSSKLTLNQQKNALSKLRKEKYNPRIKKPHSSKPNYYIRDWAKINSNNNNNNNNNNYNNDDDDGKRCAICLEDFEAREEVTLTPCNHMFHEDCIVPWVKSQGRCPVCRFEICDQLGDVSIVAAVPRQHGNENADVARGDVLDERELMYVIRAMEDAFEWDEVRPHR